MKILVLNSGSSSLKYQVIDMETEEVLAKGYYERIGQENSFLTHTVNGEKHKFERHAKNHEQAIQFVLSRLTNPHYGVIKDLSELGGIGHRVVHGGEYFSEPVIITEEVIEKIEHCNDENISKCFNIWRNATEINTSEILPINKYYVSKEKMKVRYINSLVRNDNKYERIYDISENAKEDIEKTLNYKTAKYTYLDFQFNK